MQNVARRQNHAAKNRSVKDEYNAETQRTPHPTAAMAVIAAEGDGEGRPLLQFESPFLARKAHS